MGKTEVQQLTGPLPRKLPHASFCTVLVTWSPTGSSQGRACSGLCSRGLMGQRPHKCFTVRAGSRSTGSHSQVFVRKGMHSLSQSENQVLGVTAPCSAVPEHHHQGQHAQLLTAGPGPTVYFQVVSCFGFVLFLYCLQSHLSSKNRIALDYCCSQLRLGPAS